MSHRHGTHGEAQRQTLIRAAFDIIAQKGFEGLRTREVASLGKVNIATLHYYFPSKEDLIRGVAGFLMDEFERLGRAWGKSETALERLQREFTEVVETIRVDPSVYIVMIELSNRAHRDPAVRDIVNTIQKNWQTFLESLLRDGISSGEFAAGLSIPDTAWAIRSLLLGTVTQLILDNTTIDGDTLLTLIRNIVGIK